MKAIIFDMDGLMVDTEGLYFQTERELAIKYGKRVQDETLWKMMGRKPMEAIDIYRHEVGFDISSEELLKQRDEIFAKKLLKQVSPMPGLFDILDGFKGILKMAIATGSPSKFLDIVIKNLELREYFDVLKCSDEISNGKPDPEIYIKTLEELKLSPEECFVLEDSSNGALAGKRACCHTIAVPSVYTNSQDFSFADYIAKDLADAKNYILNYIKI